MPLNIRKVNENDWSNVLQLLGEAGLREYLPTELFNKSFYVLYDSSNLIATFSINQESKIGILKAFAISKLVQGKGIGKKIANSMHLFMKDLGLNKLYASSWEAFDFWRKTTFKEISLDECNDDYFINYVKDLEEKFPVPFKKIKHFLLIK